MLDNNDDDRHRGAVRPAERGTGRRGAREVRGRHRLMAPPAVVAEQPAPVCASEEEDPLGRAGRPPDPLPRGGDLGPDDRRDRRFAGLAGLRLLPRGQPVGVPDRDDVGAAVPRGALRSAAARGRHVRDLVLVGARRVPARARGRDLPQRVREPAGRRLPQADPRDPGRDPDRRARVLRAHVRDAAAAGPRDPGRDLQRARGEPRARGHADPDDRVALRGRDGRRAERPSRRRLRPRSRQAPGVDADRRAGGDLRDHRVVRPRASRGRSARR